MINFDQIYEDSDGPAPEGGLDGIFSNPKEIYQTSPDDIKSILKYDSIEVGDEIQFKVRNNKGDFAPPDVYEGVFEDIEGDSFCFKVDNKKHRINCTDVIPESILLIGKKNFPEVAEGGQTPYEFL